MTNHPRRSIIAAIAGLCGAAFACAPGVAQQTYPSQRVNMYVGFAAGGFADTVARVVGARLGERLGQTFTAQNLEGGGGIRATRQTAAAAPDGYTLLVTTTALAINESLVAGRGYTADALEPIAIAVSAPESFSANVTGSIKSVADLVARAQAGQVYLGTPGIGSGSHISAEYFFKFYARASVRHIPFSGGGPAVLGLMTGDVNLLATTATGGTIRNMINGEINPLAIAARERSTILPKVPTFAELGFEGHEASSWAGFFAPAGTPPAVIEKLNAEINAILGEPETRQRIDAMGLQTVLRDRAATRAYFRSEIANWSRMVSAVGIAQ